MARQFQYQRRQYKNGLIVLLLSSMYATVCAKPKVINCDTADCKDLTESIAESIDWTVKPCDDFYQHACGRWTHSRPIPASAENWDSPNIIMQKVWHQLDDLLSEVKFENMDPLASKAKIAYDVCKDLNKIEEVGVQFMLSVVEDTGGWPMIMPLKERADARHCWQKVHVVYGAMIGEGALLKLNVEEDRFNRGKPTLYLDQPTSLFKGINIMRDTRDETTYKIFVKTVVEAFAEARGGGKLDPETLEKDIDTLLEFRQRLKEIMSWGLKRRNLSRMYNPTTIEDLQEWNDKINQNEKSVTINWKSFIEATIEYARHIVVTEKQTVIVHEMTYVSNLLVLLAEYDEEVIVNHIHLFFVESYLKNTNRKMKALVSAVHHGRTDIPDETDRWKTCLATHPMKHVLSLLYVKKYFPESAKVELRALLLNLQATAIEEIKKSPWLKTTVKEKAVKKMEKIGFTIGYPDWYDNQRIINEYYDGQEVTDVYLFNVLSYERAAYRREIEKLSPMNFNEDLEVYPIDLDVGYLTTKNSLDIPAAAMQLPFFGQELPSVLLYATTGHLLSHELSHAFDTIGILHDEHGLKANWWDEVSLDEYNRRLKCIMDKYSRLPIKEMLKTHPMLRPKSADTIDEDFADNLGLHTAFKSYKNIKDKGKYVSAQIPALGRLPENKIFFYAFAQMYCEYITKDAILYSVESSDHSLNRLRVNGPLANFPEFGATFGCSSKSFMNPRDKCPIWGK